ncbi:hypothetical protein FVR03_21700 [Pontibacter qinzhouensis]|uniref:Uncharacterized protein n=1 Tax=Pontibacter qinzhouensis TaxID=2603253 RepID=A0A5C8IZ25_9BACT|nr:hypothetical protein [Pontibacter qinzhouensis]TXK26540.1 hypothetical protein FVR03_21700 [Pontibacter qinzhouensis]
MEITILELVIVAFATFGVLVTAVIIFMEVETKYEAKAFKKRQAEEEAKRVPLEFTEEELEVRRKLYTLNKQMFDHIPTSYYMNQLDKDVQFLTKRLSKFKTLQLQLKEPTNPREDN